MEISLIALFFLMAWTFVLRDTEHYVFERRIQKAEQRLAETLMRSLDERDDDSQR